MVEQMYGVNQDNDIRGMVRYIREDVVPNDEEMLEFAEMATFDLDDRLCPFSREELRARAFLRGMEFAKRHATIYDPEKNAPVEGA